MQFPTKYATALAERTGKLISQASKFLVCLTTGRSLSFLDNIPPAPERDDAMSTPIPRNATNYMLRTESVRSIERALFRRNSLGCCTQRRDLRATFFSWNQCTDVAMKKYRSAWQIAGFVKRICYNQSRWDRTFRKVLDASTNRLHHDQNYKYTWTVVGPSCSISQPKQRI